MARTAKCPDCGEMFDPRGLLSHRAARHGAKTAPATQPAPSPTAAAALASTTPRPAGVDALSAGNAGNKPSQRVDVAAPRPRSTFEILGDLWSGKA